MVMGGASGLRLPVQYAEDVDGRNKSGHDERGGMAETSPAMTVGRLR
jgi:hypothetical protein